MTIRNLYTLMSVLCLLGWVWLVSSYFFQRHDIGVSVCLSKQVTDVPCPSCGTTRSVLSFFKGDFLKSVYWNPLGLVTSIIMIVSPLWLVYDLISRKRTFYKAYLLFEKKIKNPYIYVPLAILVVFNWVWNIYKGV